MGQTLTTMRTLVRENIRRPATLSALTDARLTMWINWGQRHLCRLHTFREMRSLSVATSTVASQRDYNYPSSSIKDFYSIVLVSNGSSRKLEYVSLRSFREAVPYSEQATEGKSELWIDLGTTFMLWRIPDAVYVLEMAISTYPTDLSADDSTSSLLAKDDLIVCLASMFGAMSTGDKETANTYRELFNTLLVPTIDSDPNTKDWTPVYSRGSISSTADYWLNPFVRRMP